MVTVRRALGAGDYGVTAAGRLVASVERKSLPDLVATLTSGRLGFALADLAALPRAALVVEDRYSQVFTLEHVRPAVVADGLAEAQTRWPSVPIVFCETRQLAEEWTYRFLAAAHAWALAETAVEDRIRDALGVTVADEASGGPATPDPSTAELRAWARAQGHSVSDRGRIPAGILQAWRAAHHASP